MIDVENIDKELYRSMYITPNKEEYISIWNKIKNNYQILQEAIQVKRDKFNENDIVKGLAIANVMLMDYESVDKNAYINLINTIYTNTDIARVVVEGASNGGCSFLLMSLWNHDLILTEEQKQFAVSEAMNKIGTKRYAEMMDEFNQKLTGLSISDDKTIFMDIDGSINPIGEKTYLEYMKYMSVLASKSQAHGIGEFDIRYHILRNPNWKEEEKQKLVMDFYVNSDTYDECLEQWEWNIVNDPANYKNGNISLFQKDFLYYYTYEILEKFYNDKKTTDRIWAEIEFCRLMHKIRPQQWELEYTIRER